jgi:hypothetical protein
MADSPRGTGRWRSRLEFSLLSEFVLMAVVTSDLGWGGHGRWLVAEVGSHTCLAGEIGPRG